MANLAFDNFYYAAETPSFRAVRREQAYKLIPSELQDPKETWNDKRDVYVDVPKNNNTGGSTRKLTDSSMRTVIGGNNRQTILDTLLQDTRADCWAECVWYTFSLLTIALGTQINELELATMNALVEDMPKPKHMVLYDIDMLPTYKAVYQKLRNYLPYSLSLKATHSTDTQTVH
jgi:hypothetical protein